MLEQENVVHRGLTYPWGRNNPPPADQPFEVAEGVWWVRLAMPGSLDHINVWLLEDDGGWAIVDTGLALDNTKAVWEALFEGFMAGKPVTRVICTHLHPDHTGLAGWICERFNCDLWISREEYLMCQAMVSYTGQEAPNEGIQFYRAAGYNDEQIENYRKRFGGFGRVISPLPHRFRRLVDRQTLTIGGRYWQVVVGSGHSPEHVCLYCPSLKCLISGDQVLPRITPNVSVFPTEPEGNPLGEWLDSNLRLIRLLPSDLLVLPAHQAPFRGLHVRINQVIDSHRVGLQDIYDFLDQPRRVPDCFPTMFSRPITAEILGLATGEVLAHLNLLVHRGSVSRERDANGVDWYLQNSDTTYTDIDDRIAIAT